MSSEWLTPCGRSRRFHACLYEPCPVSGFGEDLKVALTLLQNGARCRPFKIKIDGAYANRRLGNRWNKASPIRHRSDRVRTS